MKILFAIKSLNVVGGGAERVFVNVANGLLERGHNIKALTFDYPGTSFYPLSINIQRFDMAFNPAGEPMPRVGMLRALPRIRTAIAAEQPDVVVAFMHSTYVPIAMAMLGLRTPLIVSEHTEARHYQARPLQRYIRQWVDSRAALRTVPCESVRLGYAHLSSSPSEVVPNPVPSDEFRAVRLVSSEPPRVVLSVGRLMEEKGHAVLIDAFSQIESEFPDWVLRIVGDGPLRADLEAQVRGLALQRRVELPGYARDVGASYCEAHFVVLPSQYESFGMVAAEALAAGRPVLSFNDCAGIAEIVQSGCNGLLVHGASTRPGRVAALADGLRQLMANPELCMRMGQAGPAAVKRFGLEAVLDRWEATLRRAASSSQMRGTESEK